MGAEGPVPRHPRASASTARRPASCTTTRKALLDRIIHEKLLTARGVYGFWPANTDGDDIVVFARRLAPQRAGAVPDAAAAGGHPRQAAESVARRLRRAARERRARLPGHVRRHGGHRRRCAGAAVRAAITTTTTRSWSRRWPTGWPRRPPSTCTRRRARTGATASSEQLSLDDLIAEKFRGIRPAYGYPACPDHSEKFKLFSLLDAPKQGITLTEQRRDAAGRERQRPVLLASRRPSTSTSAGSAATRSSRTPAARGCGSTRSRSGSARTSPTTSPPPVATPA